MNHSKTILILLNGQAIYVGGSTVRVLEVEDVDTIDEDELARLAGRVSDRGVKCTEVADKPIRVYDCTEPVEDDFINEVEGLVDEDE
jgi:uncharacterized protein YlaI